MNRSNFKCLILLVCVFGCLQASAHSLPNTFAEIFIENNRVIIQFKTPKEIVELASKLTIDLNSASSKESVKQYYIQHISISDSLRSNWQMIIDTLYTNEADDKVVGKYEEIIAKVYLTPSNSKSLSNFILNCDLVVHQVANQSIFFSARQFNLTADDPFVQIGTISVDYATGKILPLRVHLGNNNRIDAFTNMVQLGMEHIKEGTDHLLFIITLLLPACLLASSHQWTIYAGLKNSLLKLLKIITAFTIGHSVTLMIGSLDLIKIPTQIVEITIAFSILISAIHAIIPLFYNKEVYIATGFGFIHGLAFSQTLQTLHLSKLDLAISVLGFNIGIELMQLFIILITIPWFILLSKTAYFKPIKNTLAVFVGIAAIGWIFQRVTNTSNFISNITDKLFLYSPILIIGIAILGILVFFIDKRKPFNSIVHKT